MSTVRMYHSPDDASRPTHYREAWWDDDTSEFVVHHGKVGESGTTTVERIADSDEAETLLESFAVQNTADGYVDAHDIEHEPFTVSIKFKGSSPTTIEQTNAEMFAIEYTALLAWRGIGAVEDWDTASDEGLFRFQVNAVHRNKAMKFAGEALKKTDFRVDRMKLERN